MESVCDAYSRRRPVGGAPPSPFLRRSVPPGAVPSNYSAATNAARHPRIHRPSPSVDHNVPKAPCQKPTAASPPRGDRPPAASSASAEKSIWNSRTAHRILLARHQRPAAGESSATAIHDPICWHVHIRLLDHVATLTLLPRGPLQRSAPIPSSPIPIPSHTQQQGLPHTSHPPHRLDRSHSAHLGSPPSTPPARTNAHASRGLVTAALIR